MKRFILYNKKSESIEKESCDESKFLKILENVNSFKNYEAYAIYPNYKTCETIKKTLTVISTTNQKGQTKCELSTN